MERSDKKTKDRIAAEEAKLNDPNTSWEERRRLEMRKRRRAYNQNRPTAHQSKWGES